MMSWHIPALFGASHNVMILPSPSWLRMPSRYPYMSNLASHLCPLVGAGSFVPFMAVAADGGAFATAAAKTGSLVKVCRDSC